MRCASFLGIAACFALGGARAAHAQALEIRAARRDTITAATTVSAAFTVGSQRADTVMLTPRVEVPTGWTVLTGATSFPVQSGATEMLLLSLVVPARAAAGVYPIRVRVTSSGDSIGVMDSVFVFVPPRRALDVGLVDRPGFVVSGKTYEAGFLVRNRGNLASIIRLSGRSSLGEVVMSDTVVQLDADASRVLRARVRTPQGLDAAADDVLEIVAMHADDSLSSGQASTRVTIVPEPSRKIEEFVRVPTNVRLRAASSDGVSPFEIVGHGIVRDGSDTRVDFLMRGPTGPFSVFGDRDEYRFDLTARSWRVRLGDQFFMLTPLTGGAQPGIGVGADGERGPISFGGYSQQFRRSPEKGSETGVFLAARPVEEGRFALNFVNRLGGSLPARLGSASAAFDHGAYRANAELARSDGASGIGGAHSARFSGAPSGYSFDLGHHSADTAFAGALRGSTHDYFTAGVHRFELVSFAINGGSHRTDLSQSTGVPYLERLDVGVIAATLMDHVTVELGGVSRSTTVQGVRSEGRQHGVRTRVDQPTAFGQLSLEAEAGRARDGAVPSRTFTHLSLGVRRMLRRGTIGTWAERYSGGSITQGADGNTTLGGDASIRVSQAVEMSLTGYATRLSVPGAEWNSQLDVLATHHRPNGSSISLRARVIGGGAYGGEQNVAYLEYGIPLRLPVSRLRTPGRVYGRVVDAATGNGVPGALVRLGPQIAITDKQGQVAFGGVPGGEHRLSMSQETTFADAVFVGDPTLMVDSARAEPTTFRLAIARSARLDIDARRFALARTGIAGAPDSLSDAGPLPNAMLMLVGERDTLYRTTNESGKASFTDIPPGSWTISIRGDAPAFHRFEPDRAVVRLAPAEARSLTFRLVPRRRDVQLIGTGQELRPTTADPKAARVPGATRTVKPDKNEP